MSRSHSTFYSTPKRGWLISRNGSFVGSSHTASGHAGGDRTRPVSLPISSSAPSSPRPPPTSRRSSPRHSPTRSSGHTTTTTTTLTLPFPHSIAFRPNGSSSAIHRSTCIDGCLVDASQGNLYTKSVESRSAAVRDATSLSAACDGTDSSSDPIGASFPRAMTQPPTKCTGQCIRSVTTALLARARRVLGPMYGKCACAARRVR